MPWQECYKIDERLRFVARLLDGEKMAVLCREFDVWRKTGYKIFARYKDCGLEGLTGEPRRSARRSRACKDHKVSSRDAPKHMWRRDCRARAESRGG
jgi:hypothetical protein